jgi:hypothetical protein
MQPDMPPYGLTPPDDPRSPRGKIPLIILLVVFGVGLVCCGVGALLYLTDNG